MLRSLPAVVLSLVVPAVAIAQQQFVQSPHQGNFQVVGVRDISAGDVDGDGDIDFVFGCDPLRNSLWLNDGRGGFVDATTGRLPTPAVSATRAVDLADIDGDGDLDLLVCHSNNLSNRVYRNDGAGVFTDVTALVLPPNAFWSVGQLVFDCDGDGDLDWLVFEDLSSHLYLNDGTGRFTEDTTMRLPPATFGDGISSTAVDLEGDGDLDIVFSAGIRTAVLLNGGGGRFSRAPFGYFPVDFGGQHFIADLDRDGDPDVVLAKGRAMLRNNGFGNFVDVTASSLPQSWVFGIEALVDVDGDAAPDLVGPTLLWLNDGRGRFVVADPRAPVFVNGGLLAADIDDDGDFDLVDTGGTVHLNLLRQLVGAFDPRIGFGYRIEFAVRPGFLGSAATVAPFLALGEAVIPFGSLGTVRIDPATAIGLPALTVPAQSGLASVTLNVPNDASLRGVALYLQAVIADPQLTPRLSNARKNTIQ